MRLDILMEELFPVPIERVWHALTNSRMIDRWLMRTDGFEAKVGVRFTLNDDERIRTVVATSSAGCSSFPTPPHGLVVARSG
jgi:uncharacterized protein YndB with AHSA1/START domain